MDVFAGGYRFTHIHLKYRSVISVIAVGENRGVGKVNTRTDDPDRNWRTILYFLPEPFCVVILLEGLAGKCCEAVLKIRKSAFSANLLKLPFLS